MTNGRNNFSKSYKAPVRREETLALLCAAAAAGISAGVLLAQQSDTTRNPLGGERRRRRGRAAAVRPDLPVVPRSGEDKATAARRSMRGRFARGSEDGDLFHAIRAGVPGTQMPPFAGLTDQQTWQLVTYIRSLPAPPSAAVSRAIPRRRRRRSS